MKGSGSIISSIVILIILIGLFFYGQSRIETCRQRGDKTMTCILGF
jgi:preprotein translocase subunit YajC